MIAPSDMPFVFRSRLQHAYAENTAQRHADETRLMGERLIVMQYECRFTTYHLPLKTPATQIPPSDPAAFALVVNGTPRTAAFPRALDASFKRGNRANNCGGGAGGFADIKAVVIALRGVITIAIGFGKVGTRCPTTAIGVFDFAPAIQTFP